MRLPLLTALATSLAASLALPSCSPLTGSVQAGYAQLSVDGNFGYVAGTSSVAAEQDIESAFGLGDDQGSPYARVMLDTGVQVIAVSGFLFEDEGTGVLEATFGGNPALIPGTQVRSDFELACLKGSYAFEISLGPVSIAPGIAVDYIDLNFEVRDLIGIAAEIIEVSGPVPLAFVRGQVDLGIVSGVLELGYMEYGIDQVDGSLLDIEALVHFHATTQLDLFAGYRLLALELDGEIDGDTFDTDLQVDGFVIGGGLRF